MGPKAWEQTAFPQQVLSLKALKQTAFSRQVVSLKALKQTAFSRQVVSLKAWEPSKRVVRITRLHVREHMNR